MPTVNLKISTSANDGYVNSSIGIDYADVRISANNYGMLRFLNATVPNGATIISATLRLHSDGGAHTVTGTVKGVLGNCPAWSSSPLPGALAQTSASATLPTSTSVVWVDRDVTAIVQEIVNGTWSSGNAIGVILGYTSGSGNAYYTDYGTTSSDAAELIIDWSAPPALTVATAVQNLHNTKLLIPFTVDQTVDRALGGDDYLKFELDGDSIRWVGDGVSDFNSPSDVGTNNVYNVTLTVNNISTGLSASRDIAVTVDNIIFVGGQNYGRAGATGTATQNFVLTGGIDTLPRAGDYVVNIMHIGSTTDRAMALTSGYTKELEAYQNGSGYDSNLAVFTKFMGSTPDTNFTVGSSGAAEDAQNCRILVFRGVDPTTPFDIAPFVTAFMGTAKPNPPSILPTVNGAAIIMAAGAAAATTAAWTAPAYLLGWGTQNTADTNDSVVGGGYRRWYTGDAAYDGAVWAGGGTANSANSTSFVHMALRPANSGGGGISGSATITEAADTAAATTTLAVRGTSSPTEGTDTSSSAATIRINGALSLTEAGDAVAAAGQGVTQISGVLSVTEASDTVSGVSALRLAGTSSISEAGDAVSALGVLPVVGTGSIAEASDTVTSTGAGLISGTASVSEASDNLASAAALAIRAVSAVTEQTDGVASASALALRGTLSLTDSDDQATGAAGLAVTGVLSATEASDTLSAFSGSNRTGVASITESGDSVSATGQFPISGAVSITEGADTVAAPAKIAVSGAVVATEAGDTLASIGKLTLAGTVSVTEGSDTLATSNGRSGSLSVVEAGDVIASTGTLIIRGVASIVEEMDDAAAGVGRLALTGTLAANDNDDVVSAVGSIAMLGAASIAEAGDTLDGRATMRVPLPPSTARTITDVRQGRGITTSLSDRTIRTIQDRSIVTAVTGRTVTRIGSGR